MMRIPVIAACALLLGACAPFRQAPAPRPPPDVETPSPPAPPGPGGPLPRAVYIIHGDADYLYHDARGNRQRADEAALREAREAAREATSGEVYVFHQRTGAARKLWGARGGTFEHYRSGTLVKRATYGREKVGFAAEAALLRRLAARDAPARAPLRLAYFGHEIPGDAFDAAAGSPARGEHEPDPDGSTIENAAGAPTRLTISTFTRGLRDLATALGAAPVAAASAAASENARPYELVVLSVCYGGNPAMMRALAPLAERVVASPAYLHLSYLDARPLVARDHAGSRDDDGRSGADSENGPEARRENEARLAADSIARASFDRLTRQTQTEVTVAVYDLREVVPPPSPPIAGSRGRWADCGGEGAARGVTLRYQAPRFGANRDKAARSAWQCLL